MYLAVRGRTLSGTTATGRDYNAEYNSLATPVRNCLGSIRARKSRLARNLEERQIEYGDLVAGGNARTGSLASLRRTHLIYAAYQVWAEAYRARIDTWHRAAKLRLEEDPERFPAAAAAVRHLVHIDGDQIYEELKRVAAAVISEDGSHSNAADLERFAARYRLRVEDGDLSPESQEAVVAHAVAVAAQHRQEVEKERQEMMERIRRQIADITDKRREV